MKQLIGKVLIGIHCFATLAWFPLFIILGLFKDSDGGYTLGKFPPAIQIL